METKESSLEVNKTIKQKQEDEGRDPWQKEWYLEEEKEWHKIQDLEIQERERPNQDLNEGKQNLRECDEKQTFQ